LLITASYERAREKLLRAEDTDCERKRKRLVYNCF